ncbi:SAM-dependent methyltransferase [Prauserella muralis]|uniref:Polyketide biosynthesis methyltransferase n=1 Tax=Prauserella muralis TaxID=588067 RepID=A0A2V4AMH9_9PSEU|nr:SAM-dependent methyltransferase [Prauserella muralis]PXY21427.1 polyketide biosynthesis methyltransferase [Prauserella muralis]
MSEELPPVDLERPSAGRVYDYVLGGTHNWAIDRKFADEQLKLMPAMRDGIRANRAFLGRAVRYAVEQGIRQFVDIGSGLPTQGNVHEVADEAGATDARVVYIDNEPVAHAHGQILLEETADPERHHALCRDFFDGPELWQDIVKRGWIDPAEPVCLLTVALLHFMPPELKPEQTLAYYRDRLAPGSLLVLSHVSVDEIDEEAQSNLQQIADNYKRQATHLGHWRTREEIAALFGDFELVEPGLVWVSQWRPDKPPVGDPARLRALCGVARKP